MVLLFGLQLLLLLCSCGFGASNGQECSTAKQILDSLCDMCNTRSATIAFQAEASKDISNLPNDAVVIFDKINLNLGNAYNSTTGKFTAPTDGVYSFTWTITTVAGGLFHTMFVVDGKEVSRGYLDLQASQNMFSSTKNVLVDLQRGNEAWMRTHAFHGKFLFGNHNGLSSFNGYKI